MHFPVSKLAMGIGDCSQWAVLCVLQSRGGGCGSPDKSMVSCSLGVLHPLQNVGPKCPVYLNGGPKPSLYVLMTNANFSVLFQFR